ncbi:MAG: KamA family radical SAM protein [Gammaproteobacteria bacterium]|jgi:lysine 2,3-aminomutase
MTTSVDDAEPPGSAAWYGVSTRGGATPVVELNPRRTRPPKASPARPRFPVSERSDAFRRRFYPDAARSDWNDWRWQARHRVRTLEHLARLIHLSEDERQAIRRHSGPLPVGITPYYASLLDPDNPDQPLRRTVVPVGDEYLHTRGEADDPLGEDHDSPVPGLVHRYPDRVLLLVTNFCSVYCRYCTRARLVGASGERALKHSQLEGALEYIRNTPAIRDVLISGGDPLAMDDNRLDWILGELEHIPHVEFVRIGTKQPAVLPQRINRDFIRMLKRHRPVWLSLHFTHPDELTAEVAEACNRLADAGMPLGSQTVLLKGVNDDTHTMKRLMQGLLRIRVKPYYLYQCDPISGSAHFRTPVASGLEIIRGLRGHTTGYAVPTYVIDGPQGGGKIPLLPDYIEGRDGDDLLLRNYAGQAVRYPDPVDGC